MNLLLTKKTTEDICSKQNRFFFCCLRCLKVFPIYLCFSFSCWFLCLQESNIWPFFVVFKMLIKINCKIPPEALPIIHAHSLKIGKERTKMAVPMRKTENPTILNLMKRKTHFNAFSPKLSLASLPKFITLKKCSLQ